MKDFDSARLGGQFSVIGQTSQPSFVEPAIAFMKEGGSTAAILFVSFAGVCGVMYFMTQMLEISLKSKKR